MMMKTNTIYKTVLFTLQYNMFKLPLINGHELNKRSAEIKFNLMNRRGRGL